MGDLARIRRSVKGWVISFTAALLRHAGTLALISLLILILLVILEAFFGVGRLFGLIALGGVSFFALLFVAREVWPMIARKMPTGTKPSNGRRAALALRLKELFRAWRSAARGAARWARNEAAKPYALPFVALVPLGLMLGAVHVIPASVSTSFFLVPFVVVLCIKFVSDVSAIRQYIEVPLMATGILVYVVVTGFAVLVFSGGDIPFESAFFSAAAQVNSALLVAGAILTRVPMAWRSTEKSRLTWILLAPTLLIVALCGSLIALLVRPRDATALVALSLLGILPLAVALVLWLGEEARELKRDREDG